MSLEKLKKYSEGCSEEFKRFVRYIVADKNPEVIYCTIIENYLPGEYERSKKLLYLLTTDNFNKIIPYNTPDSKFEEFYKIISKEYSNHKVQRLGKKILQEFGDYIKIEHPELAI